MRDQVVVGLVIAQPEERVPTEYSAGCKASTKLVNPSIVKIHPSRAGFVCELRRLDLVPEGTVVHVLPGGEGVDGPAALLSEEKRLESRTKHGATWFTTVVALAAPDHDGRAQAQHASGESVRQPETDVFLSPDHGDLTSQSSDVDEEVEPEVDTLGSKSRVNHDALTRLQSLDVEMLVTCKESVRYQPKQFLR